MNTNIIKHHIYGIDTIRIAAALLIFMGHSINMYNCSYGSYLIDSIILALRSPVMTMFFILSGFSINYSNYSNYEWNYHKTVQFFAKRLVQILPAYLLIHFLWLFLGNDSFIRWLFLTPFEFSALQSMYPNIIGLLHNGGTWFISCLLIAYMTFPVLRCIFFALSKKALFIITATTMVFLIYLPVVSNYYSLGSVYSNPVFRSLEFAFGVLISNCCLSMAQQSDDNNKLIKNLLGSVICVSGIIMYIYILINPHYLLNDKFNLTTAQLIMYPLFVLLLCAAFIMRSEMLERNKVLRYLSGLIYYFFILQLVLWNITDMVFHVLNSIAGFDLSSNSSKILLSFSICLLISIAIREFIDKPIKTILLNRLPVFHNSDR